LPPGSGKAGPARLGDDGQATAERIACYHRRIAELEQTVADLTERIAAISDLAAVSPQWSRD
jgi:hypothetical protein